MTSWGSGALYEEIEASNSGESRTWRALQKVRQYIPEPPADRALFYTEFDSRGMSEEQKMEEIKMHLDAIDMAYKEFD